MAKKVWYTIEIECITNNASLTCEMGDKTEIAKVKSVGLAYSIAEHLKTVYKPEYFNIIIK